MEAALQLLKLCMVFIFLALVSSEVKLKSGECPSVAPQTWGTCVHQCDSDDTCNAGDKCCTNGCGRYCISPVDLTCPELNCPELDCTQYGYKLDEYGCAMCECYRDPCPLFKCIPCPKYYNYTIIDGHLCRACDCVNSVVCPPLNCQCPPGYSYGTDINGCPTCRCEPEIKCPMLDCETDCQNGYKTDDQGCQTCQCRRKTQELGCAMPNCANDCEFGREVDINGCKTCDCMLLECPMVLCASSCPNGYKYNEHGCRTCTCKPGIRLNNVQLIWVIIGASFVCITFIVGVILLCTFKVLKFKRQEKAEKPSGATYLIVGNASPAVKL